MAAHGVDVSGLLNWGYFFMDNSRDSIDAIQAKLIAHGCRHESIHQADDGTWVLQVSRTEALTPNKLHERNIAFNQLAASCGVDSYDGWDVGRVVPDE